ncbi:hypothetical protein OIU77_004546 [Salix suchowensis]|uniref:DYW domain-containing protein n=1 Tax=Salix suchowensis TaxID=1278906 RepID=A0ABQ9AW29_9ROSI|nr:hypothetical protein OIU77_004546 [Salix suchowensis]
MLVNCSPNEFAFASVITSCDYVCCKQVHALALKTGLLASVYVGNALITRYSKRLSRIILSVMVARPVAFLSRWSFMHGGGVEFDGATLVSVLSSLSESYDGDNADMGLKGCFQLHCVSDCYRLFMETSSRDLVSWTGIITAFADREPESAVFLFRQMYREGLVPDWCTFSIVLKACAGLVTERHALAIYSQVVKAGFEDDRVLANTLIHAYASYNEAGLIRKEMDGSRVRKEPGLSWIEIENRVHEFASGGRRHPQREAIYAKLYSLIGQLKGVGYVPETSLALQDIEEEHKQEQLYHHSEKLALVFALMNEGSLRGGGAVIRIVKNIRICVDCHNFMKLASDLLQKEIVVRDSNRFHHFKNRMCSCNDYW